MESSSEKFKLESRKENFNCFISTNIQILPHLHYHMELMYVIDGEIEIEIDGDRRQMRQGDIAVVFPNQLHSGRTDHESHVLFIIFTPEMVPELTTELKTSLFERSFFVENELEVYTRQSVTECIRLQNKYTRYCTDRNVLNIYKAATLILMSDLFRQFKTVKRQMDKNVGKYQEIIEYVNTRFKEKLTLDIIASSLGINKYYISRLFEKEFHISFHEYVSAKRLLYAESQIRNTDKSITQIMYESGFKSERTFYRSFKMYFGQTPMQLRK